MSQLIKSMRNIQVIRPNIVLRILFILFGLATFWNCNDFNEHYRRVGVSLTMWLPVFVSLGWILAGVAGWWKNIWEKRYAGSFMISLISLTCAIELGYLIYESLRVGFDTVVEYLMLYMFYKITVFIVPAPVFLFFLTPKGQRKLPFLVTLLLSLVLTLPQLYIIGMAFSNVDAFVVFAIAASFLIFPLPTLFVIQICFMAFGAFLGGATIAASVATKDRR